MTCSVLARAPTTPPPPRPPPPPSPHIRRCAHPGRRLGVAAHVLPAGNHAAVEAGGAGGGVGGCSSTAHCKDEANEHSEF